LNPEIYMPAVYMVLGGLATLIGVGLYAMVAVPRPQRNGFDVDREGLDLHRHLSGHMAGHRSLDARPERRPRLEYTP